jgi:hypothetical protein
MDSKLSCGGMGHQSAQYERIRTALYFTVHGKSFGYQQVLKALGIDMVNFTAT